MNKPWKRKILPFLSWTGEINRRTLKNDLIAGITGSIIVLPQGVAFAIIAGMPPIYGLYTAMVLPIIAALYGSSKHLISGPTTAISLVVLASISDFATIGSSDYITLVLLLTFFTGLIQFTLGVVRLGTLVNFVSHSVVVGFTAGAALLIMVNQFGSLLGIPKRTGLGFLGNILHTVENISFFDAPSLIIGIATFIVALSVKKINKRLPHMLSGMIVAGILAYLMIQNGYDIRVVGELPASLPPFAMVNFSNPLLSKLIPGAFAVALLGLIEAVAIARSISTKTGQLIDPNQEFIGQGLSNIIGSFFSSYAGSGSFTRSGVNYDSGAQTPLSAIFAAVLLAIILIFVGPLAAYLPIPAMAAIIFLVSLNLINFSQVQTIIKSSKRESTVLGITFVATLTLDLEYAILLGVIFSLIFYLQRTSKPRIVSIIPNPNSSIRNFLNVRRYNLEQCPQLKIIRIEGSLFFGAVDHIQKKLANYRNRKEKYLLIVGNGINLIDASGAELLLHEAEFWEKQGGGLYISGLKKRARKGLEKGKFKQKIGKKHFFNNKETAINTIYELLDKKICSECKVKAFIECNGKSIPSN